MKALFWLCALSLIVPSMTINAMPEGIEGIASESLSLRGKVESVQVTKNTSSSTSITIKLKLELVNTGGRPIIFLRREPEFPGVVLAKKPEDFGTNNILAKSYGGPANDIAPEWAVLRSHLNQPKPVPNETRFLMPGESWCLNASVGLAVPIDPGKRDTFSSPTESLQALQQLSPIWLQVECEVWPWNLEPPAPGVEREKLKFGRMLQERWKSFGLLWIDTISSEPIKLDLKTATSKN